MTGSATNAAAVAVTVSALAFSGPAKAYETDQFYNRSQTIADSTEVLNRKVNETLSEIVAEWRKGHNEKAFVNAVYGRLGGHHWVDKLERWAMKSPDVDKLETPRYDSIYSGLPFWSVRTTFLFGIGSTIRVNDQLIGSDKIGHFFSQGRKYYRRYLRYGSEEKAAKQSAYTERAIFGSGTTGSYSNADLVANYEGYRFYRSLFDDDVVPGKPAILRWEGDGWIIQREFDWADYVNAYWDEALNMNDYDFLLYKHIRKRLLALCPQYWEQPALYRIENEDELKARYAHLGMRDTRFLRLDTLCAEREPDADLIVAAEQDGDDVEDVPAENKRPSQDAYFSPRH
ncbi:MAG: hypothetical protein ACE5FV_13705 [Woeseia sp.]